MSARDKQRPQAAAAGTTANADGASAPDMSAVPAEAIDLQIADVLGAVRYPANKDRLVDAARDAGASNELLAILDGLPEQDYAGVDDVTRLIGSNYGPGLGL
jgi:hypothetical protein